MDDPLSFIADVGALLTPEVVERVPRDLGVILVRLNCDVCSTKATSDDFHACQPTCSVQSDATCVAAGR